MNVYRTSGLFHCEKNTNGQSSYINSTAQNLRFLLRCRGQEESFIIAHFFVCYFLDFCYNIVRRF